MVLRYNGNENSYAVVPGWCALKKYMHMHTRDHICHIVLTCTSIRVIRGRKRNLWVRKRLDEFMHTYSTVVRSFKNFQDVP